MSSAGISCVVWDTALYCLQDIPGLPLKKLESDNFEFCRAIRTERGVRLGLKQVYNEFGGHTYIGVDLVTDTARRLTMNMVKSLESPCLRRTGLKQLRLRGCPVDYRYKETVDWGIIKREWIHDDPEYTITLEKHEEDRFTVRITHKQCDLEYYSYWKASGKLTFGSLEEAQAFAADRLAKMKSGDYQFCTGQAAIAKGENTRHQ